MISSDFPSIPGHPQLLLPLGDLLARVDEPNAHWTDLPTRPGLYLILWPAELPLEIRPEAGAAGEGLRQRWQAINHRTPTDILYIGKADSLRQRIRQLARFGRGHATNHPGGRDLWWIDGIEQAGLLIVECPDGRQTGFENESLERFHAEHADYPLGNRLGPGGVERWWPA